MSRYLWRILLVTFVGCPMAVVAASALKLSVVSTGGLLASQTYLRGTLLHIGPLVFSVLPVVVAVAALLYVGASLLVRGRVGMPERPRLVTWLILADFVLPIGLVAMTLFVHIM